MHVHSNNHNKLYNYIYILLTRVNYLLLILSISIGYYFEKLMCNNGFYYIYCILLVVLSLHFTGVAMSCSVY